MAYIDIALSLDQLAADENRCIKVGEQQIALFRRAEGVFALDNICPHRGAPLHEGFVTDGQVTCPWHQWQFDLQDGHCRNIPGASVPAYPVEIRDGTIWIDLENPQKKTP